jgi:hypothetical protein
MWYRHVVGIGSLCPPWFAPHYVAYKASRCRRFIGTLFAPDESGRPRHDERSQWQRKYLADDLENKKMISPRKVAFDHRFEFFLLLRFFVFCEFENFDFAILIFRDSC